MHWLRLKTIQSWLNIEPDEFKPTGLCFAISFVWGFSQMFNWTASSTLFLQYYDSKDLPLISIASAVLIPLSGLLFIQLGRWLRFSSLFLLFAGLFVLAPVLFWFLLQHPGWHWASMGFAVWYYLEVAFAALLLDALVNRLFNLRQARRVFGPIATGSDIAGVPAGVLLALVVKQAGVENLLLIDAAVNLIVVCVFVFVLRIYQERMEPAAVVAEEDEEEESGSVMQILALFRNPLVLCILALGALSEFSLEFINNAFYNRTEAFLSRPEQMASFLGQFFAVASVLSSIVQMLASSRLMTLLGIRGCLILGPALVGCMLLAFAGSSLAGMTTAIIFGCMAGAKFVQFTVMVNVNDVTQFTLIRSLPPEYRDRVLALSGTVMSPLLGGLSGLALLGMIHYLNVAAVGISLAAVFILAARIFIGMKTGELYRQNLKQMLNNRVLTGVELPLSDTETLRTLLSMLGNPNPQAALSALELIGRQPYPGMKPALEEALNHPDPAVRRQAAIIFQAHSAREDLPALSRLLEAERDPGTIAELLPAVGKAGKEASLKTLEPYLQRTEPEIIGGACAGLIIHCGDAGARIGGQALEGLVHSTDAGRRAQAAATLGKIGRSAFEKLLVPLLADPRIEVREKAIEAAAHLGQPGLGAAVLANVTDPDLRPTVVRSLTEGSETMLPSIEAMYNAPEQSSAMKVTIVRLYGRIRSEASIAYLKQKLDEPRRELQREILKALAQCHYRPRHGETGGVEALLLQSGSCAAWLMACIVAIKPREHGALLTQALEFELHKVKDVIFMLLGFLYPAESMRFIRYAYFHSKSDEKIATAVELLENLLSKEHRKFVLPILEPASPEQRLWELSAIFPAVPGGIVERLGEILGRKFGCDSQWLQAVTLGFISQSPGLAGEVKMPRDDDLLLAARRWVEPVKFVWQGAPCRGLSVVEKVAALKRAGIFALVPEEILSDYAPALVEQRFPAGAVVLRRGENSSTVCVIVEGSVRIHVGAQTITELHAGDIFGELSALDPEPRSADVDTITETRLLEMEAATIQRMIADRGEAGDGIIRMLCRRIQTTIREGAYQDTGRWSLAQVQHHDVPAAQLEDVEKMVLLKTVGLFSTLPEALLMHLARLAREYRLEAGASLFRQGDFGTSMYVIVDGEVVVHDADDKVIATLRQGEIIGELALLTSELRSSSVTALRPTRLLKITQGAFGELMWDHRQMARNLIRVLARRLRKMIGASGPAGADGETREQAPA